MLANFTASMIWRGSAAGVFSRFTTCLALVDAMAAARLDSSASFTVP